MTGSAARQINNNNNNNDQRQRERADRCLLPRHSGHSGFAFSGSSLAVGQVRTRRPHRRQRAHQELPPEGAGRSSHVVLPGASEPRCATWRTSAQCAARSAADWKRSRLRARLETIDEAVEVIRKKGSVFNVDQWLSLQCLYADPDYQCTICPLHRHRHNCRRRKQQRSGHASKEFFESVSGEATTGLDIPHKQTKQSGWTSTKTETAPAGGRITFLLSISAAYDGNGKLISSRPKPKPRQHQQADAAHFLSSISAATTGMEPCQKDQPKSNKKQQLHSDAFRIRCFSFSITTGP
ncbi:hypothetical protein niasHT_037602 [Heterodera trifolii]|uniref:Uncharacterized protein n=1 Tax=Heterodera trifolii TaxID=157864 RepID=A0ABD2J4N4_9BILA